MPTITKKQKAVLDFIEKSINKNGHSPSYREIAEKFDVQVGAIQTVIKALTSKGYLEKLEGIARGFKIINAKNDYFKNNFTIIPVYGKVAAGEPIFVDDNIRGYAAIQKNRKHNGQEYGLTIQGDSMIKKHIVDGDSIIVRKQNYANDGDIVVALVNGEVTCKIFRKRGREVWLQPANDNYKDIKQPFEILGILLELTREFNLVYG